MEKGKNGIYLPPEQYAELEALAKKHDLTVDQLAEGLLEAQLVATRHKELFFPGFKWMAPKAAIIFARVLKRDLPKLRNWLKDEDHIEICAHGEDGELYIMNMSEMSGQKD